jgi:tetratricopeptide (TPR) repeat protein
MRIRSTGGKDAGVSVVMAALLGFAALMLGGCASTGDVQQLDAGFAALGQKQYDKAIALADAYLAQNATGGAAAEAKYLRGRAIYARPKADGVAAARDMGEARMLYLQALGLSPSSNLDGLLHADIANIAYHQDNFVVAEREWLAAYEKLDDANVKAVVYYQVARSRQRMTPPNWAGADQVYDLVIANWPNTDLARTAAEKKGYHEFWVQVAAYTRPADADVALAALQRAGHPAIRKPTPQAHIVLVGPLPNYTAAKAKRDQLLGTYRDAFIKP